MGKLVDSLVGAILWWGRSRISPARWAASGPAFHLPPPGEACIPFSVSASLGVWSSVHLLLVPQLQAAACAVALVRVGLVGTPLPLPGPQDLSGPVGTVSNPFGGPADSTSQARKSPDQVTFTLPVSLCGAPQKPLRACGPCSVGASRLGLCLVRGLRPAVRLQLLFGPLAASSAGLLIAASPSPVSGLGYDPCSPELPKPPVQRENGAPPREGDPRSGILELELVSRAIEAVRSEVELEQRRYQELLETARGCSAAEAPALAPRGPAAGLDDDTFPLSFDYNPGGCSLLSPNPSYQPTPLAAPAELGSKYSLDQAQGHGGGGGGTLEYVPKAVGQSRRYGRPVPSSKYVLDDSKPSTDLEYDPLSNFSARLLSRASCRDERAPKRPCGPRGSEPYTPVLKKPYDPFGGCDARFSDSDDDATAPGDRPATASPPQTPVGTEDKAPEKPGPGEGREPEEGSLRETKEMAVQCDVGDLGQPPQAPQPAPRATPSCPTSAQEPSGTKEGRPKRRNSAEGARRKDGGKEGERGRPAEKPCVDKRGPQGSSPRHGAERPEGTKKKPSPATPVASSGKGRPGRPGPRPNPTSGGALQPPNRKGGKAPSGKLAERKARSLDEGASRGAPKLQKRALSHADLFGDESEDEGPGPMAPAPQPPTLACLGSSSDSDSDSSLGLPAARGPHKRLKAFLPPLPAPASPSSSASSGAGMDVDYLALEKEVDFDSDPMEECLRIFNESTSVKTEDRGRLARQVRVHAGWGGRPPARFPGLVCQDGALPQCRPLNSFRIQEASVAACCPLHPVQKEDAGLQPAWPGSCGSVRACSSRGVSGAGRPPGPPRSLSSPQGQPPPVWAPLSGVPT